jgi:GR25 family glycosyltransferase involved in LPS biosynthesis
MLVTSGSHAAEADSRGSWRGAGSDRPFIPAYVISLPDAELRRRNMTSRLGDAGMPFRFIDAVDGRTQRIPDEVDGAAIVRTPFTRDAAIACAVSHRHLHKAIAEGESDIALILEDDAELAPDFAQVVRDALAFDFDVFKLEGINLARRRVTVGRVGQRAVIVTSFPSSGSAAYLLRRAAARRLCSLPVIDQVPDLVFGDPRLGLRVLELDPFCVRQDSETPSQIVGAANPTYLPQAQRSVRRLVQSFRRKMMIARLHGPMILIRLELQRMPRKK